MTTDHTAYSHWFIFDGVGAVDGEMFTDYQSLIRTVGYHDTPDYVVKAFDAKTNAMADVTELVAHDWWASMWNDTFDKVSAGSGDYCFLSRFYQRQVCDFEAQIYAAENAADAWRNNMMAAE